MGTSRSEERPAVFALIPPLIAAVPLACSSSFRDFYSVPNAAAAALVLLFAAGALFLSRSFDRAPSRLDAPLLFGLLVAALCSAASIDPAMSLHGRYPDALFSLSGLAGCAAALWLGRALSRAGLSASLQRWLVLASVPISLYALLQYAGVEPLFPGVLLHDGRRAASTLGGPVFLGAFLACAVPLCLEARTQRPRAAAAALLLALAALAATGTRSAWLGAAAGAALWLLLSRRGRPLPWKPLLLTAAALASLWLTVSLRRPQTGLADQERLTMWKIALVQFRETPWLGSGPDTYPYAYRRLRATTRGWVHDQAHNDLFQVLSTMGLAGLAAYLWLHLALLRCAADSLRRGAPGAAAAAAAVAAVWVLAKLNGVHYSGVWPACCLAGALAAEDGAEERAAALRAPLFLLCAALAAFSSLRAAHADRLARAGILARRAGALRDGAGCLERAVAARPEVLPYRFDLVFLLWDAADGAEAAGRRLLLDRAAEAALGGVRRQPLHPEAYWLLGSAEKKRGPERLPAAEAAWREALALDPGYERVSKALQALNDARK